MQVAIKRALKDDEFQRNRLVYPSATKFISIILNVKGSSDETSTYSEQDKKATTSYII